MTHTPLVTHWKRNSRGYYEYDIQIPDGKDKDQLKDAMSISTELDKTIDDAIKRALGFKERNKAITKQIRDELKKNKKTTKPPVK